MITDLFLSMSLSVQNIHLNDDGFDTKLYPNGFSEALTSSRFMSMYVLSKVSHQVMDILISSLE